MPVAIHSLRSTARTRSATIREMQHFSSTPENESTWFITLVTLLDWNALHGFLYRSHNVHKINSKHIIKLTPKPAHSRLVRSPDLEGGIGELEADGKLVCDN